MKILGKDHTIWTILAKASKVIGIKMGFILPTLKAKFIFKIFRCSYGDRLQVCGPVYLRLNKMGCVRIGKNVNLTARFHTNSVGITNPLMLECIGDGQIIIGDYSGLTSAVISSRTLIKIGDYVKIGGNVRLFDHDFHALDYLSRRNGATDFPKVKTAEIVIGDDVFIGTGAIILKGVHIGARTIVAAASVVTIKDIPEDSIVAGNPAKIVGKMKTNIQRVN